MFLKYPDKFPNITTHIENGILPSLDELKTPVRSYLRELLLAEWCFIKLHTILKSE